ncbi:MAG: hypothetical protein RLZZ196_1487 [Bacteroidota bacterium]|jgi:chromosome partitioning protein
MKVISVLNQKGGSGKTTIATHLARGFQMMGQEVLLVDSDPQGSSRDWAASNPNCPVCTIGIDRPTIHRDLKGIVKKDIVIIDGAPQAQDLAVSAITASDMVLIPVQPSPYDIWAASDLVELVKQRIEITEGKLLAAFIISRAIKGTKISAEVAEALIQYGLPVFRSRTNQRVIYPTSASTGMTVMDLEPNSDAATEIHELVKEITDFFVKQKS